MLSSPMNNPAMLSGATAQSDAAKNAASASTSASASTFSALLSDVKRVNASPFQVLRVIRDTIFGHITVAQNKETRQLVALKISSLERIQHAQSQRSTPENPIEEARLLKQLSNGTGGPGHRNVMRLVDEFVLDGAHFAALELADQGDLFGVIERHGRLSEAVVRKLLLQMIAGVHYLHDCGVAHLDLKPENLLFTSAGEIKICDFGMARVVAPSRFKAAAIASTSAAASSEMKALDFKPKTLQGAVGTVMYMAPEVFAGQPFDPFAADVYSLGVILYLLLTGGHAYELPTARDARFSAIYSGRAGLVRLLHALGHQSLLSADAVDLMSRMMCPAAERYSLQQLLAHPWMAATVAEAQAAAAAAAKQQAVAATATAAAATAAVAVAAVAAVAAAKTTVAAAVKSISISTNTTNNGVADMDTGSDTPRGTPRGAAGSKQAFVFGAAPAAEAKAAAEQVTAPRKASNMIPMTNIRKGGAIADRNKTVAVGGADKPQPALQPAVFVAPLPRSQRQSFFTTAAA